MELGIIGVGKLGICLALLLEKAGFSVHVSDKNADYLNKIKNKKLNSDEPEVNSLLQSATKIFTYQNNEEVIEKTDTIFCVTATPSLENNTYDISSINEVAKEISNTKYKNRKTLVVISTVNPGDCDSLQNEYPNINLIYSPEFIAQGSIINDILNTENIIIGGNNLDIMNHIKEIYHSINLKTPAPNFMSCKAAEITKIAINCFLTTKISFANMIGQILYKSGLESEIESVLSTIGQDSRIGQKYLKFGFGFGGPCFPRDNKAFCAYTNKIGITNGLGENTDRFNDSHLEFLYNYFENKNVLNLPYYFDHLSYKNKTNIFTESQQLMLANLFIKNNKKVYCKNNKELKSYLGNNNYTVLLDNLIFVEDKENIKENFYEVKV